MDASRKTPATIDAYIRRFPPPVRAKLQALRDAVRGQAPGAVEKISYQIPTFYLHGNLVHFAAFAGHISFFPTSSGIRAFSSELSPYETSKGTIRFPLDEPLPLPLIRKIVRFRVAENTATAARPASKKPAAKAAKK